MTWPNRRYHYVANIGTIASNEPPTTHGVFSTNTHAAVHLHGIIGHGTITTHQFRTLRTQGYLELPNNRYAEIVRCACGRNPDHITS